MTQPSPYHEIDVEALPDLVRFWEPGRDPMLLGRIWGAVLQRFHDLGVHKIDLALAPSQADPALPSSQTKAPRKRHAATDIKSAPTSADALLRTPREAAARLHCSVKTLFSHVDSGALRYVTVGQGRKRPRKMFTDSDLNEFISNQTRKDPPASWPSSRTRARPSGGSTSRSEVVAFTTRPNAGTSGKRKR